MTWLEAGRDLSLALQGEYDPMLVCGSVYAAVMGSYAAIALGDRLGTTHSRAGRALWLAGGAVAMGAGVWIMHFIGMLAFELPVEMRYEVPTTLASMLPAIVAAAATLYVITGAPARHARILTGGTLLGAGIGVMHYSGMAAMRFAGDMRYDPLLVTASVLIAVLLAVSALAIRVSLARAVPGGFLAAASRPLAALVMGTAISGMHYTAMAAVYFFPGASHLAAEGEWLADAAGLAVVVGVLAGVVIGLAIVAIHESEIRRQRRSARDMQRRNDELEVRVDERTRELTAANAALREQNDALAAINDLSGVLQSSATADDACDAVRVYLARLFSGASGVLYLAQGNEGYLERVRDWGRGDGDEGALDRTECWALRRGALHVAGNPDQDLVCGHVRRGAGAHVCAPLLAHGDTIGLLHLEDAHWRSMAQPPRHLPLAVEQISLAIANLRLRERLFVQSTRDALTGLFNRRYFVETLSRELSRALREGTALSVALIDVDRFKQVNDTHGHDAGDRVLRELATLLLERSRACDVAARYGGEEFALLLPGAARADAHRIVDRVREAVSRLELEHAALDIGTVTLSAGIAGIPGDEAAAQALITIADERLYEAKTGGRNRVVSASSAS